MGDPAGRELLRFEPPVQYLPNRAALEDITIDGTTIPKGSGLTLLLAAANRDPGRFTDPDRFWVIACTSRKGGATARGRRTGI